MCFSPDPYLSARCWLSQSKLISDRSDSRLWELMILLQCVPVICLIGPGRSRQWPSLPSVGLSSDLPPDTSLILLFFWALAFGPFSVCLSSWRGDLTFSSNLFPGHPPSPGWAVERGTWALLSLKTAHQVLVLLWRVSCSQLQGMSAEPKDRRELPHVLNLTCPCFNLEFLIPFRFTTPQLSLACGRSPPNQVSFLPSLFS